MEEEHQSELTHLEEAHGPLGLTVQCQMATRFQPNFKGSWEVLEESRKKLLCLNCLLHIHNIENIL